MRYFNLTGGKLTVSSVKLLISISLFSFLSGLSVVYAPPVLAEVSKRGLHRVMLGATTQEGDDIALYQGSHALLIGVSKYTNGWSDLSSIPSELDDVEKALHAKNFNIIRLNDPDDKELRNGITEFINDYGYDPGNRLLFFFSGHGHSENNKGYLVPANAPMPDDRPGFRRRAISMNQFMTWARDIEAKHALFLFDSCFAGSVFKSKNIPSKAERYIRQATKKPVRQFITAGSADEVVPARSTFTPAFVAAIEGEGDINNDGYITGSELGLHLSQLVPKFVGQTPQYGKIRDYDLAQGDFVFFQSKDADAETKANTIKSQDSFDALVWQSVEKRDNKAEYEAYLRKFPNGLFSEIARIRINELNPNLSPSKTHQNVYQINDIPRNIKNKSDNILSAWSNWVEENGARKASIAVSYNGALVAHKGIGRLATTPTLTASLSKAVTGICLAKVLENEDLSFNSTLTAATKTLESDATLRELLTHSSGYALDVTQDVSSYPGFDWEYLYWMSNEEIKSGKSNRYKFVYNNANYAMVGAAIKHLTGKSYEQACNELVLKPAGIESASLHPEWRIMSSWGGWNLSAVDHQKFIRTYFSNTEVLNNNPTSYPNINIGDGARYGMGYAFRRGQNGGFNYWHSGSWKVQLNGKPKSYGAFFARWDNGWSVTANHNIPNRNGSHSALDRALANAAHQL